MEFSSKIQKKKGYCEKKMWVVRQSDSNPNDNNNQEISAGNTQKVCFYQIARLFDNVRKFLLNCDDFKIDQD